MVKPLEKEFRLIVPAMDGFYDNCPEDFTNFSDQARQIGINSYYAEIQCVNMIKGVYNRG